MFKETKMNNGKYEQKDNSGALFKNNRRQKDTDPHYTGKIVVNGQVFWVSGWSNESQSGERYLSVKVRPFVEKPNGGQDQKPSEDF